MSALTADAVAGYAYAVGLRGDPLSVAVAVAHAESSFDTTSHAGPPQFPKDDSYGLWQINMTNAAGGPQRRKDFALKKDSDLFDPKINAKAMYAISKGGTYWKPWSTYTSGAYRKYLTEAQAAASSVTARNGGTTTTPIESAGTPVLAGAALPPGGDLDLRNISIPLPFPTMGAAQHYQGADILQYLGVDGHVELGVDQLTEVTMTFADALGTLHPWTALLMYSNYQLYDLALVLAGQEWGDNGDVPQLTVRMRPQVIDNLRSNDPHTSTSQMWSNMSPSEVIAERCAAAGARFYGKATAQRATITRAGIDDASSSSSSTVAETDWDLFQRLAKEEGFWLFECAGAVYFAPPSWLWGRTTSFDVRYRGTAEENANGFEVLGVPRCVASLDDYPYGSRAIARTITFLLNRARGEQVRAGMTCVFVGVPGFEHRPGDSNQPAQWIVTKNTWPLDGGVGPCEITLTEAIDPLPQPAADDALAETDVAPAGVAGPKGGGAFPTGTGVSNQGKGSYGFQYDAVGSTPATGPQPGAVVLMNHLLAKYPQSTNSGIFNNRPVDGTSTLSVHAEGRAGDSGVPRSSAMGDALASYLVGNANLMGIQLIIWNARLWSARTRKWRDFKAANGKTDDTSLHRNHVHWELCWEAAHYLNAAALKGAIAHGSTSDGGFW